MPGYHSLNKLKYTPVHKQGPGLDAVVRLAARTGLRIGKGQSCIRTLLLLLVTQAAITYTWAQEAEDRIVVAQKGEGIFAILRRMDMQPEHYLEPFIELNKHSLDSSKHLVAGRTYILPERVPLQVVAGTEKPGTTLESTPRAVPADTKLYPVFGEKHAEVAVESNVLKGATLYIVSGHGGPDPGAIGTYGPHTISEDEYAYDVSLRLALNLIRNGAVVHIIIQDPDDGIRDDAVLRMDTDESASVNREIPLNQRQRLKQRTDAINRLCTEDSGRYQRVIAIHVDSRSSGKNIDVFFYHHHGSNGGHSLARNLHHTFRSKYAQHQPGRQYHGTVSARSGLYIIKNTRPPVVYIELGNIRNTRDQRRLVVYHNRQALANWIAQGIIRDYTSKQ